MGRDTTTSINTNGGPHALGRALRALRYEANITQKELAARVGTSEAYISNVESGRRDVRWTTINRLLDALDADLHRLADALADTKLDVPQKP